MSEKIVVSTAYAAPVQYYTKLVSGTTVLIEACENYTKQTYRNRCDILGANGKLTLSIPVKKGRIRKIPIRDLKISYHQDWQRLHQRSMEAAYRSSPFFEFYFDDLIPFYQSKTTFLFDYNFQFLQTICNCLEISPVIEFSSDFYKQYTNDFRDVIHPKKNTIALDASFQPQKYTQVFSQKRGFVPNLSILDLLFNEGPNAVNVLKNSIIG